jgi:hypothetical protein
MSGQNVSALALQRQNVLAKKYIRDKKYRLQSISAIKRSAKKAV